MRLAIRFEASNFLLAFAIFEIEQMHIATRKPDQMHSVADQGTVVEIAIFGIIVLRFSTNEVCTTVFLKQLLLVDVFQHVCFTQFVLLNIHCFSLRVVHTLTGIVLH